MKHYYHLLYKLVVRISLFPLVWTCPKTKKKNYACRPQEVAQSVRTTPHEAEVTNSNSLSPLLCGHVQKKKKNYACLVMKFENTLKP
jgi:hypothetical protein